MAISEVDVQKSPSRLKSVAQWIWAITLAVAVVIFVVSALRFKRTRASAAWPVTSGTVLVSELQYAPLSKNANKYQLQLTYRYNVKGVRYESHRVSYVQKTSFIGRTSGERYVKKALKTYPKGATVTVHYHPSDPRQAVLETNLPNRVLKPLLISLAMTLLSLTGLWRRWTMQTNYLFRPYDPDAPMTTNKFILGALGLFVCLGIAWVWWELIKVYAGR